MTIETNARIQIATAARELLDLYDREPELFARVMTLLSLQDIETLREIATWNEQ